MSFQFEPSPRAETKAVPSAFAGDQVDIHGLFDLTTYPIHLQADPRRRAVIDQTRKQLNAVGCAVLHGFVKPPAIAAMEREAYALFGQRTVQRNLVNPYFTKDDPALDAWHPQRFFAEKSSSFINSDVLEPCSTLRMIYDSDVLIKFLSDCLGISPIFRWADPLARNPYSVMEENDYFPWHFDGNDFTVSILICESNGGGVFEYVPGIRSSENENFDAVAKVLHEDRSAVRELSLTVGDLQLFKGRYSLHRVTRVTGTRPRIIGLPTYVTDPYLVNKPLHSEMLYGRSLPIHHQRQDLKHIDQLMD